MQAKERTDGVTPSGAGTPFFLGEPAPWTAGGLRACRLPLVFAVLFFLPLWFKSEVHAAGTDRPLLPVSAAAGATRTAEALGNTPAGRPRVVLQADRIQYLENENRLFAEGQVRLWYGSVTLTAQTMEADLAEHWVHAEHQVVLSETGREVKVEQMDYDLVGHSAHAKSLRLVMPPWYYCGTEVEKQGEKRVRIWHPRFTTCNARYPHYSMTASRVELVLGESLAAYNVTFYVGAVPLFYIPYFWRSLNDHRPPFSIRVGYNDYSGFFAKLRYNYQWPGSNEGGLLLDLMEKKGYGLGLDQNYVFSGLGQGKGSLSLFGVHDPGFQEERFTGNVSHRQTLSPADELALNLDYVSDRQFNRDFGMAWVDNFQQKSYLNYTHRESGYYLGMGIQDVETQDPVSGQYYASLREMPNLQYSLYSQRVAQVLSPVYFSLSSSLRRAYQRTSPDQADAYATAVSATPLFTETLVFPRSLPTQPSLSASLSLPVNATAADPAAGSNWLEELHGTAGYTASLTLTNKWVNFQRTKPTQLLQSRLGYAFARSLWNPDFARLANAGVSQNLASLGLDYYLGSQADFHADTSYNLLAQPETSWRERWAPVYFNGRASLAENVTANGQARYDWLQNQFSSAYLGTTFQGGRVWNLTLTGSYSSSAALGTPGSVQTLLGTLSAGWNPPWGIGVQTYTQYDFNLKQWDRFTVNLTRDLHCWMLEAGFSIDSVQKVEIGVGINLKAFPEFRAGTGGAQGTTLGK